MITINGPFVLLDDARLRGTAPARLYRDPVEIIVARTVDEVTAALDAIAAATRRGQYAAGYMAYEAGSAFEPKLVPQYGSQAAPLLWFGVFERYEQIATDDVTALLPSPNAAWIGAPQPRITQSEHARVLAQAKSYIAAGDIYQANLTFACDVPFEGHPLALYAGLRARARAGYGGVIFTGDQWLLTLSPELFFTLEGLTITTKPMKGTAARHPASQHDDSEAILRLAEDPKQRAENLMIVDLLRNDLSRVAEAGSVKVPALFEIETYPSVHQMTSTVTAQLRDGLTATDILHSIFPCGSITGAPKIRAMEIINEIEAMPRGVYTGCIGQIDPDGDAAFNVAIRTLQFERGLNMATMGHATLGLGSGIVADSGAQSEWQECLDKGAFVASPINFDLIETMRFDPDGGITLIEGHLTRLAASAKQFGFRFDRHTVRNALQSATIRHRTAGKLRLLLSKSGAISVTLSALPLKPEGPVECIIVPLPVDVSDMRLRHKTSNRSFYDEARHKTGAFEVLFTDPQGFLTEGSFTSIFVSKHGKLLTPPLTRGLLPGVFRAALLASGDVEEGDLTANDLHDGFFIGNALRGLLPACLKTE